MKFTKAMKKLQLIVGLVLFFCTINFIANAQSWSVSKTSAKLAEGSIIYIESVYHKSGAIKGINDTLTGTAFLLCDGNKIYLVTTKHLVQALLYDKNQQLINDSLFITPGWKTNGRVFKLTGLSDGNEQKRGFIFSDDMEDIAIISLQKGSYKSLLPAMLKQGCKPVPIDSIDVSSNHQPGEMFFLPTYTVYKNSDGVRTRVQNIRPGKIKLYNKNMAFFTIDVFVNQSNNGSPIFMKDKIIGVFSNEEGIITNADIIRNPYLTAMSGNITKASYILPLLRKLQQNENISGFN